MDKCSFCEELQFNLECENINRTIDIHHTYTVAIVSTSVYKGRNKGRTLYYKENGVGFSLKFCPECGEKLDGVLHG